MDTPQFQVKLTARQQQILDLIQSAIARTGAPPTRAEIATELGFRSANAAEEHLQALARKGVIELVSGTSRGPRPIFSWVAAWISLYRRRDWRRRCGTSVKWAWRSVKRASSEIAADRVASQGLAAAHARTSGTASSCDRLGCGTRSYGGLGQCQWEPANNARTALMSQW